MMTCPICKLLESTFGLAACNSSTVIPNLSAMLPKVSPFTILYSCDPSGMVAGATDSTAADSAGVNGFGASEATLVASGFWLATILPSLFSSYVKVSKSKASPCDFSFALLTTCDVFNTLSALAALTVGLADDFFTTPGSSVLVCETCSIAAWTPGICVVAATPIAPATPAITFLLGIRAIFNTPFNFIPIHYSYKIY
jgi:hypothetical protein